jgi:hypothetical protein
MWGGSLAVCSLSLSTNKRLFINFDIFSEGDDDAGKCLRLRSDICRDNGMRD